MAGFALLLIVTQCGALSGVAETGLGCNGFGDASTTGISLTGASVNPARSFGPALAMATQGNTVALDQVWVFIFASLAGAALAAVLFGLFKAFYQQEA